MRSISPSRAALRLLAALLVATWLIFVASPATIAGVASDQIVGAALLGYSAVFAAQSLRRGWVDLAICATAGACAAASALLWGFSPAVAAATLTISFALVGAAIRRVRAWNRRPPGDPARREAQTGPARRAADHRGRRARRPAQPHRGSAAPLDHLR